MPCATSKTCIISLAHSVHRPIISVFKAYTVCILCNCLSIFVKHFETVHSKQEVAIVLYCDLSMYNFNIYKIGLDNRKLRLQAWSKTPFSKKNRHISLVCEGKTEGSSVLPSGTWHWFSAVNWKCNWLPNPPAIWLYSTALSIVT